MSAPQAIVPALAELLAALARIAERVEREAPAVVAATLPAAESRVRSVEPKESPKTAA